MRVLISENVRHKVGAGRRGGRLAAVDAMDHFFPNHEVSMPEFT